MKIKIPFHDNFLISLSSGNKTMTTRSKRYGTLGDIFSIRKNINFMIMGVFRVELKTIKRKWYRQEGFRTPKEFKDFWLTIHRKWQPDKKFYLHTFKRI